MSKIRRIAAVFSAAALLTIAGAGCSAPEEDASGISEDQLGQSEAPLARFRPHIQTLKSAFTAGGTPEEVANSLLRSGRPAAFSLQSLCRLYKGEDPKFKEMHDDFKALEDGIGQYAKWDEIYQAGVSQGKDAATLERFKTQRTDALARFTRSLTDRQWLTDGNTPSRIQTIDDFLNARDWKTRASDRKVILSRLIKELEELKETRYDMTILEYGNGVHELRRDLRWILLEQVALNGMIVVEDGGEACPIPAYASLPTGDRYANLRGTASEPSPCKVAQCVVVGAAKAVSDLGTIKDEAEAEVNLAGKAEADVVPERLQPQAKALYEGLISNDLFGVYAKQLESCRDTL